MKAEQRNGDQFLFGQLQSVMSKGTEPLDFLVMRIKFLKN